MNKSFKHAAVLVILLVGATGCGDQLMNLTPQDQVSDATVWQDPALTEAFLNDIYLGLGHGLHNAMLAGMTDEAIFTHGRGTELVAQSIISPGELGAFGRTPFFLHFRWNNLYSHIRQTNIFLSQIDEANIADAAWKDRMKGEAHFLRAYFYHNLMRLFGGVPLITQVYELNEDYSVARDAFAETVEFIVADADSAAALLPRRSQLAAADLGRATRGAALALKARTLLYAASDLYHVNPSGMPETGYTGADRQALYRRAKQAAQAVMDLGEYALFRPDPATPEEATANYAELFLRPNTEETILNRYFLQTRNDRYHPGRANGPNGYHLWGGNTPIQQLVDDYQMIDGTAFDWNDPEHAAAPYENRDPRFYASVLYDGADWRERPGDMIEYDPSGTIQTVLALTLPDGTVLPGLDTRDGPVEDWNGTHTGYYLRKFMDPAVNQQFEKQEVPWPFFRYGEVLLNYAEASIALGEEADARRVLNQIRRRAGMPEFGGDVSGQALWQQYVNERRIEMAYEEQRFFDVRRWMLAPQELDEAAERVVITADALDRADRSTYSNYEYDVQPAQERAWNDKLYFLPIPQAEMNRNDRLVQNPGY